MIESPVTLPNVADSVGRKSQQCGDVDDVDVSQNIQPMAAANGFGTNWLPLYSAA